MSRPGGTGKGSMHEGIDMHSQFLNLAIDQVYCYHPSHMSVCGWVVMWVWLAMFVRMCVSNFLFTLGLSLVFKSMSSVFNRPSSVFKIISLVFLSSGI